MVGAHVPRRTLTDRFYHRTDLDCARSILEHGFRDGVGRYLTPKLWQGVWISDRPLDSNEGAEGGALLEIRIPPSKILPFEWIEKGKGYREFLVPAELLNTSGGVRIVDKGRKLSRV